MDSHTQTLLDERNELLDWIVVAPPDCRTKAPAFMSTRLLIQERKRTRMALECALDYAHDMAPEDAATIRAAYEGLGDCIP